jgi:putative hydrolase of the HAD superfamily
MIKAYVFDLDGTLHDQEASEREALEKLFRQDILLDPMPSFSNFLRAWRNASEETLQSSPTGQLSFEEKRARRVMDTHAQFGAEIDQAKALDLFRRYVAHYERSWRPYADALGVLQGLGKAYRLGVITNGDSAMQHGKIKACGLEGQLEQVIVSGDVDVSKPDPAIFRLSQKAFGLDAKDMAYVGDRLETDALAAQRAGWQGIWINRKHMPGGGADGGIRVISALTELLDGV